MAAAAERWGYAGPGMEAAGPWRSGAAGPKRPQVALQERGAAPGPRQGAGGHRCEERPGGLQDAAPPSVGSLKLKNNIIIVVVVVIIILDLEIDVYGILAKCSRWNHRTIQSLIL